MTVVFVSNYYSYHQAALSEQLYRLTDGNFRFIATGVMDEDRIRMGWGSEALPDYVLTYNDDPAECDRLLLSADAAILGSSPYALKEKRLAAGKLSFLYAERTNKVVSYRLLRAIPMFRRMYGKWDCLYFLCASAFLPVDFRFVTPHKDRFYRWGYFPQVNTYDIRSLLAGKKPRSILWAGRFIDWKHPEACLDVAEKLLADGITDFTLDMIGDGELRESIREQVTARHLDDHVRLPGSMPPEEVRRRMEESAVYIFTSDRQEGWGAVLNESMNSGCAVVASGEIGSVPYLLRHGENGFVYRDGDTDDLYRKVKTLLTDTEKREKFGEVAYHTLADLWNAEVAAKRLLELAENLRDGKTADIYSDGPCSKAPVIKDGWERRANYAKK